MNNKLVQKALKVMLVIQNYRTIQTLIYTPGRALHPQTTAGITGSLANGPEKPHHIALY